MKKAKPQQRAQSQNKKKTKKQTNDKKSHKTIKKCIFNCPLVIYTANGGRRAAGIVGGAAGRWVITAPLSTR